MAAPSLPAQPFVAHVVDRALDAFCLGGPSAFASFVALHESARDLSCRFSSLAAPDKERVERFWLDAAWFGVYAGSGGLSVLDFEERAGLPLASLPAAFAGRWRQTLRIAEQWGPRFWWTLKNAAVPLLERETATALATGIRPPILFRDMGIDTLCLPLAPSRNFLDKLARIASGPSPLRTFLDRWPAFFANFLTTTVRRAHRLRLIAARDYDIGTAELADYLNTYAVKPPAQSLQLPSLPVILERPTRNRRVLPEIEVPRHHPRDSVHRESTPATPDHDSNLPESPSTPRQSRAHGSHIESDEDFTIPDFDDSTIHGSTIHNTTIHDTAIHDTTEDEPANAQLLTPVDENMTNHSAPPTRHSTPLNDLDTRHRHRSHPPAMPETAPSPTETAEILKSVLAHGTPTTEMHCIADPVMNRLVSLFPEIISLHHARQRKSEARIRCLAASDQIIQAEKDTSIANPQHEALEAQLAEIRSKIASTAAAQETFQQPIDDSLPDALKAMLQANKSTSITAFASTLTQLRSSEDDLVTQVATSAQVLATSKHNLHNLRDDAIALEKVEAEAVERCNTLANQVKAEIKMLVEKLERIVECTDEFIPRQIAEGEGGGKRSKVANAGIARLS